MLSKQCPNICEKLILRADTFIPDDNCVNLRLKSWDFPLKRVPTKEGDPTNILDKIIVTDSEMSFYQDVMQYNYTQIRKDRQNAISHFHNQFGLDFSSTVPNKENISTIDGAILKPFYISPEIKYTSNYGCVRQGGWIVLIVDQGTTLTGKYGESEEKRADPGTMLLFGYYNILNCRIIHFRSSIPSKTTKKDFWSIKVDIWDPTLDRKYKKMTGWYKKHHHMLLMAKENCKEHNIPDEGLWGNTSGCSSLTKKGDVWHIMIKTILEFSTSFKKPDGISSLNRGESERVGGGESTSTSTTTSKAPKIWNTINSKYFIEEMKEAINTLSLPYIRKIAPVWIPKFEELFEQNILKNIDTLENLLHYTNKIRRGYIGRSYLKILDIYNYLFTTWFTYFKVYIIGIKKTKFFVDTSAEEIIKNKKFMDRYMSLFGMNKIEDGGIFENPARFKSKFIDDLYDQKTIENVQDFYRKIRMIYFSIMERRESRKVDKASLIEYIDKDLSSSKPSEIYENLHRNFGEIKLQFTED